MELLIGFKQLNTALHAVMCFILIYCQIINAVGAFDLKATLNCEAFAREHSSTAHYDVKSFVGLAVSS
jgi:hypothetical protein